MNDPSVPLWALTATELAAAYRSGATNPADALEAVLERIEALNPQINAIVTIDLNGARNAARSSALRWRAGNFLSPLDGVPLTVKDNLFVDGLRTTWGSKLFADFIAPQDDLPVARLREAGCVIVGKTNTPELAMAGHTNNLLFGATANPWSPDRSPGGSSGGSAASVASGFGPLSIGTDAGGSIRRPAGYSGVAGLKPGLGRVPRRFGFPALAHDFQVVGPMARSVADLKEIFKVMAAPGAPSKYRDGMRIAAFRSVGTSPVDPAVSRSFDAACAALREFGHSVDIIEPLWSSDEVGPIFNSIVASGIARVVTTFEDWANRVTPGIAGEVADGLQLSATDYLRALDRLAEFRSRVQAAVEFWDAVVTPSAACLPWPIDEPYAKIIDGKPASPRAAGVFSVAVNLAGLPAIVVPAPREVGALPSGLQMVGPVGSEDTLLDLAAVFEAGCPWERIAGQ